MAANGEFSCVFVLMQSILLLLLLIGGNLDVKNITNELVDVAEWEPVGINLGLSAAKLAEIKASRMNNAPLCKISMADAWLRSDLDATWEKLAVALDKSGNDKQAERIRTNYGVSDNSNS